MPNESVLSVFQHRNFVASLDRRTPKNITPDAKALVGGTSYLRRMFFSQVDGAFRDVGGVLFGEYLLLPNCLLLLDRRGVPMTVAGRQYVEPGADVDKLCSTAMFTSFVDRVLEDWDEFGVVNNGAVLSDPFSYNYYHWTTELIPRIRLFEMNSVRRLLLSVSSLDNRFQTSLLSYAMGGSMVQPIGDAPVRVRDPIVADGLASEQGLLWLRDRTKLRARRGSRRIYIRRGSAGHRRSRGGGVAETPEFCKLIQDYNFDVVEFSADMSVAAQVGMIDGAGIVIAAHGSALTNICYLDPGVALIEILGAAAPRGVYMEIAAYLGLAYQGYMSVETDADQNLVVCPKWLEGLLINFAAHGAPGLSEAPLEPVPSEPPKTPVRRKTHSMSPVAAC